MDQNPFTQFISTIESVKHGSNTVYMTVLNYGYIPYTMNMLISLSKWGLDRKILLVCLDRKSYEFLIQRGYTSACCFDTNITDFEAFGKGEYAKICFFKLLSICKILELGYDILYTDGDIVYFKNPIEAMKEFTGEYDIWIQNDMYMEGFKDNMCTGYFYLKSNETTREQFNLDSDIAKYNFFTGDYDQCYFNLHIKPHILCKLLPLVDYPNGQVFYGNPGLRNSCVLAHFNWIKGHEKMDKMKEHGVWVEGGGALWECAPTRR